MSASDKGATTLEGLVIGIFGPTASGKSSVAEAIAARVPATIISVDSMQVYRGVGVLTNQPTYPTRLVGIWPLAHEGSVGEFATRAHGEVDTALGRGRIPILAGGTGLYFRAAIADMDIPPVGPDGSRARWERLYDRRGAVVAHAQLRERDARAAAVIHPNDRRRVVRALELADVGRSLRPRDDRLWSDKTRHPTLVVGLEVDRDVLRDRIRERTQTMVDRGAEAEAQRALAGSISTAARELIGLRELTELSREDAVAAIELRTGQYAAYQRKWMRRIPGIVTVQADRPPGEIADEILEMARARQRLPAGRAG